MQSLFLSHPNRAKNMSLIHSISKHRDFSHVFIVEIKDKLSLNLHFSLLKLIILATKHTLLIHTVCYYSPSQTFVWIQCCQMSNIELCVRLKSRYTYVNKDTNWKECIYLYKVTRASNCFKYIQYYRYTRYMIKTIYSYLFSFDKKAYIVLN